MAAVREVLSVSLDPLVRSRLVSIAALQKRPLSRVTEDVCAAGIKALTGVDPLPAPKDFEWSAPAAR